MKMVGEYLEESARELDGEIINVEKPVKTVEQTVKASIGLQYLQIFTWYFCSLFITCPSIF